MQALLEATQGSCGVTEQACQIVLIGVSGFVQRNQGIGFGGAILPGVVRVDDAMDKNDALVPFGLEGNAFIHEDHLRNRGEVGKEIACMRIRVHGRIGCPGFPEKKSGQVLVRTLEGEKPSQMRLGCKSCTAISCWGRGRCERHPDRRLKKRTGFGSHPGERKAKPDAAGMQVVHGDFLLGSREMRAASRRAVEKADRFWFAPLRDTLPAQMRLGRELCEYLPPSRTAA